MQAWRHKCAIAQGYDEMENYRPLENGSWYAT